MEGIENRKNWFLVEIGGRPFIFCGKRLEIWGFFNEKIHGKRSFGVVFLGRVYYNVDRSGVKWFFVVKKHHKSG